MSFDNTKDSRWRPDLESARRRVREEEQEEAERQQAGGAVEVVYSRELSFVPRRRAPERAGHDAQTLALIAQHERLEQLPHGDTVVDLLSEWRWLDAMKGPEEKQQFIEPMIAAVRRDPVANEYALVFLLTIFEPLRRSVSKAFMSARAGLTPRETDLRWINRAEARMIDEIDKQTLYDVSRAATIEAIYRYPAKPPRYFFLWLREAIAHRVLNALRAELPEIKTICRNPAEAEAMQNALAGFEAVDPPPMREAAGLGDWRRRFYMRGLYDIVEQYFVERSVRDICRTAVDRLPRCQRDAIESHYLQEIPVATLASLRRKSPSTIYSSLDQAERNLAADDGFFIALYRLGVVRGQARADAIRARYPDGRMPDGRRIVIIDEAA